MPTLLWLLVFSVRPILDSSLSSTSHRQPQVPESAAPSFGCPQDFTGVQDSTARPGLPPFSTESVSLCPTQNEAATPPLPWQWLSPASSQDPVTVMLACRIDAAFI